VHQVGKKNKFKNDARFIRVTKSSIAMAKTEFNKEKILFPDNLDLNLREKIVKGYIWSLSLCGAESCSIRRDGRTDMTKHIVAIGICLAKHSKIRRTPL
jgi:hypothetical protein